MKAAPIFEAETCGRCGGSGRYSYNQIDGDLCYGCNGAGVRLTKRGAAANEYLIALRSVRADSIKPGDLIRDNGVPGVAKAAFHKVTAVHAGEPARWTVDGVSREVPGWVIECDGYALHTTPDAQVRKGWSIEDKRAQVQQALAYQATLTKAGTPRKGAATPTSVPQPAAAPSE